MGSFWFDADGMFGGFYRVPEKDGVSGANGVDEQLLENVSHLVRLFILHKEHYKK